MKASINISIMTCVDFHLLSEMGKGILQISTVSPLETDIVEVMVLSPFPETRRSRLEIFSLPKILPEGKEKWASNSVLGTQLNSCYNFLFFFFSSDSIFFLLTCGEVKMPTAFSVSYKIKLMWLLNNVKCGLSSQFSSVTQLCQTFWDYMDCSTLGFPVHHQLPEVTQTHVHWVGDAIQLSPPLSSPSPAFNLSQHQGLFQGVNSLHQVAKVLEFQLQHQSFQWTFKTDFL